jgi:hypothetical protein
MTALFTGAAGLINYGDFPPAAHDDPSQTPTFTETLTPQARRGALTIVVVGLSG